MSQVINQELEQFTLFLNEQVRSGHAPMSPEEALELWRESHPSVDEQEEDEKLLAALARMDAGIPGKPHEQFDREFRDRHGLPAK